MWARRAHDHRRRGPGMGRLDTHRGRRLEGRIRPRNDGRNLYIIMVFRTPPPNVRAKIFPIHPRLYGHEGLFHDRGEEEQGRGILFQKKQYTADALIASLEKQGRDPDGSPESGDPQTADPCRLHRGAHQAEEGSAATGAADEAEPPIFRVYREGAVDGHEFMIPLSRDRRRARPASGQAGLRMGRHDQSDPARHDGRPGRREQSAPGTALSHPMPVSVMPNQAEGGGGRTAASRELSRNPRYAKHAFWVDAKLAAQGK